MPDALYHRPMHPDIIAYNREQTPEHQAICDKLSQEIEKHLPDSENKVWHRHPVWFIDGNPTVGYSPRKDGSINLMFWSGQSFDEPDLRPEGTFRAAEIRYMTVDDVNTEDLARWLQKSATIQWDYKNLIKHKGTLKRLK